MLSDLRKVRETVRATLAPKTPSLAAAFASGKKPVATKMTPKITLADIRRAM